MNRIAFLALIAVAIPAIAQNYPSKPIKYIVPFQPGGTTDILGRIVALKLQEAWGQPVVVENRPGAGGAVGAEMTAKAAPDGYTILQVTSTHTINPSLLATPYDAVRDFAPVATIVATETLFVVNLSVPAKNVQELIALAKSKPGQINFGSSGSGTTNHLQLELFSIMAGIKMQHIPYKGAGPALIDLMGGRIELFTNNAVPLMPLVKSGKIRPIAVSGEKRLRSLPDVPTFTQSGFPGYEVKSWQGILAPAKTPKPIIDKLSQELSRIIQTPEVAENLITMGADPFVGNAQAFAALIKADLARYAKLIKAANIKLE